MSYPDADHNLPKDLDPWKICLPTAFEPAKAATKLTLADVVAALPLAGFAPRRLMDLQSAFRTICGIAGRSPEHSRSTFRRFGASFDRGAGNAGLSRKTLQNLKSNLGAAIAASGLKSAKPTAGNLAPARAMALRSIEDRGPWTTLSRLARFSRLARLR